MPLRFAIVGILLALVIGVVIGGALHLPGRYAFDAEGVYVLDTATGDVAIVTANPEFARQRSVYKLQRKPVPGRFDGPEGRRLLGLD